VPSLSKIPRPKRTAFWRDQRGANMTEYIILLALIAIIVMAAVQIFGTVVHNQYDNNRKKVNQL
jgi:Flp pilus assembly pilin Flp